MGRALQFATSHAFGQALGMLAGLLVIRLLDYDQYALYVLMGALVGAAAVTCDLGVSAAILTLAVRDDQGPRAALLGEAQALRRLLTGISLAGVMLLAWLVPAAHDRSGWPFLAAVLVTGAIVAVQSRVSLTAAWGASDGRLTALSCGAIAAAVVRLILVGGMFWWALAAGGMAPLLAWLAASAVQLAVLRGASAAPAPGRDPATRRRILAFVRPLWPGHLYYVLHGLVPTFALAWAGVTRNVAEFGALGRLGQVIVVLAVLNPYVIQPFVARARGGDYAARSLGALAMMACALAGVVLSGYLLPQLWLLLLGASYHHLTAYVGPVLLAVALRVLAGTTYAVTLASGDTRYQFVAVAVGVASQASFLLLHPIAGVADAIAFSIVTSLVALVAHLGLLGRVVLERRQRPRGPGQAAPVDGPVGQA